jgi:hypothetical protein
MQPEGKNNMGTNCGIWANIQDSSDVEWTTTLRDAVEFCIGPVELTIYSRALEALATKATEAHQALQQHVTRHGVDSTAQGQGAEQHPATG